MSDQTILTAFRERSESAPGELFAEVVGGATRAVLTNANLRERAERWAGRLAELGCGRGDVVILILRHGPDIYSAFLGCVMAGCIPSAMPFLTPKQDPRLYWESHDALFRRIAARCVVTYPENAAGLEAMISTRSYAVAVTGSERDCAPLRAWRTGPGGEVALLQHSSGTTGLKKGVALSHQAILRQVESYAQTLGFARGDVIASWLPLYHDMGLIAAFMLPLVCGGAIVSLDAFEWVARPQSLLAEIERAKARWTWLPNFAFNHLVNTRPPEERHDLSSVSAFINCSEPCKAASFDRFAEAFADCGVTPERLQVCYAMAETVFAVTQTPPGAPAPRRAVSAAGIALGRAVPPAGEGDAVEMLACGEAIAGIAVRIVGADGQPLPDGGIGEIETAGEFLFDGYFKLPEDTQKAFDGAWYRTGDLGFRLGGQLFVTGRIKDLIIVNGKNFYAHDVEAIAGGIGGIKPGRVVAVGLFNEKSGSEEMLVIGETGVEEPDAVRDLRKSVRMAVQSGLGLAGVSVHLVRTGWLVKTTSGKISRKENVAKYLRERQS